MAIRRESRILPDARFHILLKCNGLQIERPERSEFFLILQRGFLRPCFVPTNSIDRGYAWCILLEAGLHIQKNVCIIYKLAMEAKHMRKGILLSMVVAFATAHAFDGAMKGFLLQGQTDGGYTHAWHEAKIGGEVAPTYDQSLGALDASVSAGYGITERIGAFARFGTARLWTAGDGDGIWLFQPGVGCLFAPFRNDKLLFEGSAAYALTRYARNNPEFSTNVGISVRAGAGYRILKMLTIWAKIGYGRSKTIVEMPTQEPMDGTPLERLYNPSLRTSGEVSTIEVHNDEHYMLTSIGIALTIF